VLLSGVLDGLFYIIDISPYIDSIKSDILFRNNKEKASLEESDKIIQLARTYFQILLLIGAIIIYRIFILVDLDAVLNAHGWAYYRMTDDFEYFAN